MTVTELIALIDDMCALTATSATKVRYMNLALTKLSPYFGIRIEDASLVTVADQDAYAYPTGLEDISQIVSLAVATSATPDTRYNYTKYHRAFRETNPQSEYSYYQIISDSGAKKLCIYPVPSVADKVIVIRFDRDLALLDAGVLTASPEFDSKYHEILAYYCCHRLFSAGSSADREQADYYFREYEEIVDELWKKYMEEDDAQQNKIKCNPQWINYSTYSKGFKDA